MRILGISAFHRNAAAALVIDGQPVAAIQEDRYTKRLQDESFPIRAVRACLAQAGIQVRDLDRIVFYEKPLRKFERELVSLIAAFPRSASPFSRSMFLWLGDRLWMKNRITDELELEDPERVLFTEHQLAHAASAYYSSPFEKAAVLTLDDGGEWATTALAQGTDSALEILAEVRFPHSLGLLVSAIAQYLGLEPGAQDHVLESLASHGTPRFADEFARIVQPQDGGSFSIDQKMMRFSFDRRLLFDEGLEELLGPARKSGGSLRFTPGDSRDADVAASVQHVIEERTLDICRELHKRVPLDALCFAGKLAENRALCARILRDGPFSRLYVPPAPDDAGAALGAALYVHHIKGNAERSVLDHAALGLAVEHRPEDGAMALGSAEQAEATILDRLVAGERIGWVRGVHEFGAQSLGNRSVLADPRPEDARTRLLGSLQHYESYLPCRVAIPAERAAEFFDLPSGAELPLRFAQLTVPARDQLHAVAPSAIQPDGTAWPQLVDEGQDPVFHRLLRRFGERTGAPLLLHSTFALRGSPMVRVEADAVAAFLRTELDCLVVEDRMYEQTSTTGLPPRPSMS